GKSMVEESARGGELQHISKTLTQLPKQLAGRELAISGMVRGVPSPLTSWPSAAHC
ncbi:unnamed protein product, partial [marine sediment metagenome]